MHPAVAATGGAQVTSLRSSLAGGARGDLAGVGGRSAPTARVSAPGAVPGRVGER